jgi:hypothetical protein
MLRLRILLTFLLALAASAAPRRTAFNDGWRFLKGDAPGAEQVAFDDSAWRALTLPHDFAIEGPSTPSTPPALAASPFTARPGTASGLPSPPAVIQITAKQLVTKLVKGYRRHEWQKMRERNEALDCRVYARTAAGRIGTERFQEKHWAELELRVVAIRAMEKLSETPETGNTRATSNRVRFRMEV